MTFDPMQSKLEGIEPGRIAERFREAREDMRQLDEALGRLGSPREPQRRLDRAPMPVPTIPIFNPTVFSY